MGNKKSMTPKKKQEINRVISEAMELKTHRYWKDLDRNPVYILDGHIFNPVDSISDALNAVDVIFSGGQLEIILDRDSNESWTCSIWHYRDELYTAGPETRPAAVSLALYEKIKEK